ncbi:MAG: cell envelope integrity protein TolA [Bacteroidetes bacterium]|nr:cell envelope integrity protein TolA [Bacteroidota bacterium]
MAASEKKNKRIAAVTSIGIHSALLILFLFLMAWRQPNPPDKYKLPGVEINLGFVDEGSGEVQPNEQPGTENPVPEEQTEQTIPQPEEKVEEQQPEEQVVSKEESHVVVKEQKKEPVKEKPIEKPVDSKPKETKPIEEKKTEPTKPAESKQGKNVPSQGDDKGKTGDKGNPDGKPDAKALYPEPGGGGGGDGAKLEMDGWVWATQPEKPTNLPDNEPGIVEFEIECDANGDIFRIVPKKKGLSPTAENLLKLAIQKGSLLRKSNTPAPPRSKGTVVFVLKTQ